MMKLVRNLWRRIRRKKTQAVGAWETGCIVSAAALNRHIMEAFGTDMPDDPAPGSAPFGCISPRLAIGRVHFVGCDGQCGQWHVVQP